jgi:hypothetical protein
MTLDGSGLVTIATSRVDQLPSYAAAGKSFMGGLVVSSYRNFIRGVWKVQPPANVDLMEDNNLIIDSDGAWKKS